MVGSMVVRQTEKKLSKHYCEKKIKVVTWTLGVIFMQNSRKEEMCIDLNVVVKSKLKYIRP